MISVCMASYNGERFINDQIESILNQLNLEDELIICDDRSTDKTIEIIKSFADRRIKLVVNESNLGYVKNFEKCIQLASHDIVTLSDQDDIWLEGKISFVKKSFIQDEELSLLQHGVHTVDTNGHLLKDNFNYVNSRYNSLGKFINLSKLVIKSHFIGCAMSFRKSHLMRCAPYDSGLIFSHDHWIAINAFWAGKVICVNTPFIHYRQHDSNLTPKKGLSLSGKLKVRLKLIYLVFKSFNRNNN